MSKQKDDVTTLVTVVFGIFAILLVAVCHADNVKPRKSKMTEAQITQLFWRCAHEHKGNKQRECQAEYARIITALYAQRR